MASNTSNCTPRPPQAIGRLVPAHQRGALREVCQAWADALAADVGGVIELPLIALVPPPTWEAALFGPSTSRDRGRGGLPRERLWALRRLVRRFPGATTLRIIHNRQLPPASVQVKHAAAERHHSAAHPLYSRQNPSPRRGPNLPTRSSPPAQAALAVLPELFLPGPEDAVRGGRWAPCQRPGPDQGRASGVQ
jgi:hypothetical protein